MFIIGGHAVEEALPTTRKLRPHHSVRSARVGECTLQVEVDRHSEVRADAFVHQSWPSPVCFTVPLLLAFQRPSRKTRASPQKRSQRRPSTRRRFRRTTPTCNSQCKCRTVCGQKYCRITPFLVWNLRSVQVGSTLAPVLLQSATTETF